MAKWLTAATQKERSTSCPLVSSWNDPLIFPLADFLSIKSQSNIMPWKALPDLTLKEPHLVSIYHITQCLSLSDYFVFFINLL